MRSTRWNLFNSSQAHLGPTLDLRSPDRPELYCGDLGTYCAHCLVKKKKRNPESIGPTIYRENLSKMTSLFSIWLSSAVPADCERNRHMTQWSLANVKAHTSFFGGIYLWKSCSRHSVIARGIVRVEVSNPACLLRAHTCRRRKGERLVWGQNLGYTEIKDL